ncbi:coproporphyrinogen III oxidase [Ceratobasidium sp. AG-Ba]|nr:coproporphyrinogen III oxidase [Ceratobasidium sp. AG-Ba]
MDMSVNNTDYTTISASAVFDSNGNLKTLTTWGGPGLQFQVEGQTHDPAPGDDEVLGNLIWHDDFVAGQTYTFQAALLTDLAGPNKGSKCYITSIDGAQPGGALYRTERPPKNPQTLKGSGTWVRVQPPGPTDVRGTYQYLLRVQQMMIHEVENLKPKGAKFVKVEIPPPADGVTSVCYVLEKTSTIKDPEDPGYEPIEKAGIVVTLALNRQMPSQGDQNAIRGFNKPNEDVFVPSAGSYFEAAHLSIMIHPRSPHAPICHTSIRHFELFSKGSENEEPVKQHSAHGGALHLVPSLLHDDQCSRFHSSVQTIVDRHGEGFHSAAKDWCDKYFYDETRKQRLGIGGIFFDNLGSQPNPKLDQAAKRPTTPEECSGFIFDVTQDWSSAFMENLKKFAWQPWTKRERQWQLNQRGHIIDYFMCCDMGFRFGLATKSGSLQAMRLVLPPLASWEDLDEDKLPKKAKKLLEVVRRHKPIDWTSKGN